MALSDLLDRLRRDRPPPGPPTRTVGVPRSEADDVATELAGVLTELEDVEREIARVRDDGRRRADEVRSAASRRAARILAAARERAPVEEASAAAREHEQATNEATALLAEAEREAERIAALAEQRLPGLVTRMRACVAEGGP